MANDLKPENASKGLHQMDRPKSEDENIDDELSGSSAPLLDHLTELRTRLIICVAAIFIAFIGCFFFSNQLLNYVVLPFSEVAPEESIYFGPFGKFFAQIRVSLYAAIMISFPVIAFQVYKFVAPGLYERERKALLPFVLAMPVLFTAGAALVYYVMVPFVMRFAVGFEADAGDGAPVKYELLTDVGHYLSLVTTLMLAFGLTFQLPVLLTLIARAGLLTSALLRKFRKVAIVGIFAIAAFLTPPDPFSQIVLAMTIIGLYEVSIFSVGMAEKKVNMSREGDLGDEGAS